MDWRVEDVVVEVGDEPLCARITGEHESRVGEKFEVDIPAINDVAAELAVRVEVVPILSTVMSLIRGHVEKWLDLVRASASLILND